VLNNVAIQVNRANRQRTLRDANAIDCALYTKQVDRESDSSAFDGSPTLGGAGMISDEDEVNYSWVYACEGRVVFAEPFAPDLGNTSDDGTRLNYPTGDIQASIEQIPNPGAEGYVQPAKRMLVTLFMGGNLLLNYEIVDVTGNLNIPPYTRLYLLSPRPDEPETSGLTPP
jgi:hypothetical protein